MLFDNLQMLAKSSSKFKKMKWAVELLIEPIYKRVTNLRNNLVAVFLSEEVMLDCGVGVNERR